MNTERGFSLMEVCVVMAIVALLAVVIIPVMQNQSQRAEHARLRNQVLNFSLAADAHYLKHGSYAGMAVDGNSVGAVAIWQPGAAGEGFSFVLTQAGLREYELQVQQQGRLLVIFRSSGERGFDHDGDGNIAANEMHW